MAGLVAFGGAILAAALLPSRPGRKTSSDIEIDRDVVDVAALEPVLSTDGEVDPADPILVTDPTVGTDEEPT